METVYGSEAEIPSIIDEAKKDLQLMYTKVLKDKEDEIGRPLPSHSMIYEWYRDTRLKIYNEWFTKWFGT